MFSIPTVTTSLSGFGLWVRKYFKDPGNGIAVIERTDDNEAQVITNISGFIRNFMGLPDEEDKESQGKSTRDFKNCHVGQSR